MPMPESSRASRPRKKAAPFATNAAASSSIDQSSFNDEMMSPSAMRERGGSQDTWDSFEGAVMTKRNEPKGGFYWRGAVIVIVLAVLAGAAGFLSTKPNIGFAKKSGEAYSAIFLNNGQVYFGVIKDERNQYMSLDNVFYLQLMNETIPAAEEGEEPQVVQRPQLVRKGDEYYGPDRSIRINREQIAVIEGLREDSDILRQIKERLAAEAAAPAQQ